MASSVPPNMEVAPSSRLDRVVVPSRLALIYRNGETLGYNPSLNNWHRLDEFKAELLRWLRASRDRNSLVNHLMRRFSLSESVAAESIHKCIDWCIVRRLLYLDQEPSPPVLSHPPKPLATVYWISTQACNLRCTYCYQDAMVARPHELSTDEARRLIDQVAAAGAKTFIITGGEPFSRRDLLENARYSKRRGLRTNVITNGHYITPKNVRLVAEVFDLVTISLDHGVPEHHDRHRGFGSWKRAVAAIELLTKEEVRVDVNSVLSHLGLRDLDELFQFIKTQHIGQHRITPQFPMGRGASARADELTPSEVLSLGDHIHDAKQRTDGGMMTDMKTKTEGASYSKKGKLRTHCGAGLSEISVDPEGWVYPCKLLQYPEFRTENVRDASLDDIYHKHPILGAVRETTADTLDDCKTCIINRNCGGGCRGIHFSFTHEYNKCSPLFCSYLRHTFEVAAWESTGDVPAPRTQAATLRFNEDDARSHLPFVPLSSLKRQS